MGGGHDHTLPFLRLRRTEYNSQKEDEKMAMASSFSPPGKWRTVVVLTLHHSSRRGERRKPCFHCSRYGAALGSLKQLCRAGSLFWKGMVLKLSTKMSSSVAGECGHGHPLSLPWPLPLSFSRVWSGGDSPLSQ